MSANMAEPLTNTQSVEAPLFVINLCASTSPMALAHPANPELKRYTFFVTRQREEGRERFRLHMGYFATQEAAEELLENVRDIYPAAWAGPAPTSGGAPRRAKAVPVAAPALVTAAPPASATSTVTAPRPVATAASVAPAAPVTAAAPVAATPVPATAAPVKAPPPVAGAAAIPAAAKAPPVKQTAVPAAAASTPSPAPVSVPPASPLESMSNVRDVLAQLSDDSGTAVRATAPPIASTTPPLQPPRIQDIPKLQAAVPPRLTTIMAPARAPVDAPTVLQPALSESQLLRVLEPQLPRTEEDQVRVVTPEDTQTLQDIRLDAQNNAPPCFAVQLMWSVSPIDISNLPHLAIFDAYTLYNVEGSRQGRRWYGLRLGFFKNPNAATQVAYYVRSDYQSVAVVPVSNKERENAKDHDVAVPVAARVGSSTPALQPELQTPIEKQGLDGFELLQDDRPVPAKRDVEDAPTGKAAVPRGAAAGAKAPQKAAGKPTGKRVAVRKRPVLDARPAARGAPGASTPLESTLEILGASTLTLDESHVIINDSAVRKPVNKKSGSGGRFARLLNKLGGT